jgi:hypothetical protein
MSSSRGALSERSVRRIGLRRGGRSRRGRCCAPARPGGAAERRDRCLWCRTLDGQDVAGQAPPAAGVQNDGPSTRALASPRLPAQHAPADRTARLQRDRLRNAATRRRRPGLPRHSPQRAVSHDLGSPQRALLHAIRHALPEGADAGGTVARATVLRSRPGDRGRLLRLLPRPDRGRPQLDRASPDPRLHLPQRRHWAPTSTASTTPTARAMRRLLPHRLHPAAATRPQLRRHPLPQLPRPMERARSRPAPLRRQPRRRRMRDVTTERAAPYRDRGLH